jgi:hypothetical protein
MAGQKQKKQSNSSGSKNKGSKVEKEIERTDDVKETSTAV